MVMKWSPWSSPMGDLVGQLDLVDEALERPRVLGDIGPDELDGHFFAGLDVEGPVDAAHAAPAKLFDDLVTTGEKGARGQVPGAGLIGSRGGIRGGRGAGARVGRPQDGRAVAAEIGRLGILSVAGRAKGGHRSSLVESRFSGTSSSDPPDLSPALIRLYVLED